MAAAETKKSAAPLAFTALPERMQAYVFSFLPTSEHALLQSTCKVLRVLGRRETTWPKTLDLFAHRHFPRRMLFKLPARRLVLPKHCRFLNSWLKNAGRMTSLRELCMRGLVLKYELPYAQLQRLTKLEILHCEMSDASLRGIGLLSILEHLDMTGTATCARPHLPAAMA